MLHLPCGQTRVQIGRLASSDSSIRNTSAANTDDSDEVDALAIRVSEILSQLNRPQQNFTSQTGPASIPCEIQSRVPWEGRKVPFKQIKERYEIKWAHPIGQGAYGKVVEAIDRKTKQVCLP